MTIVWPVPELGLILTLATRPCRALPPASRGRLRDEAPSGESRTRRPAIRYTLVRGQEDYS